MKYIKYLTRYFKWTFVAYFVFFLTTAALIPINADADPETFPSTVPAEIVSWSPKLVPPDAIDFAVQMKGSSSHEEAIFG